jgi:hypothetical protein
VPDPCHGPQLPYRPRMALPCWREALAVAHQPRTETAELKEAKFESNYAHEMGFDEKRLAFSSMIQVTL